MLAQKGRWRLLASSFGFDRLNRVEADKRRGACRGHQKMISTDSDYQPGRPAPSACGDSYRKSSVFKLEKDVAQVALPPVSNLSCDLLGLKRRGENGPHPSVHFYKIGVTNHVHNFF
jgi:hypothetical protein